MAFFRKFFQSSSKKKKDYPNIIQGVDPLEAWRKVGELGDGAFGKVFKVRRRWLGKREGGRERGGRLLRCLTQDYCGSRGRERERSCSMVHPVTRSASLGSAVGVTRTSFICPMTLICVAFCDRPSMCWRVAS